MAQSIEDLMADGYSKRSAQAIRNSQVEKEKKKKGNEMGDAMNAVGNLKNNANARSRAVDDILGWK